MKGVESVVITEYLCDELLNLTLLGNVLKVGLSEGPGPDGSAAKVVSSLTLTAYKGLEVEEKRPRVYLLTGALVSSRLSAGGDTQVSLGQAWQGEGGPLQTASSWSVSRNLMAKC